MAPKKEFEDAVKRHAETQVRQGLKAVLEEVFEEEMTGHLEAGYGELILTRRGERNGPAPEKPPSPGG